MPVYSFGEESPVKFDISDKTAKYYNQAAERWLKAHRRFTQKFGRRWDPFKDPIIVKWNRHQKSAWNQVADMFNKLTNGYDHPAGPFHPSDFMDDFLVRNASESASKAVAKWKHVLVLAVGVGTLYELLRRR